MVFDDAGFSPGVTLHIEMPDASEGDALRDGFLEGFLEKGSLIVHESREREADVRLRIADRGVHDGVIRVSVVGLRLDDERYVFSRAYEVPLREGSILEDLMAPVLIISSAVIAVYLLLTVRSS